MTKFTRLDVEYAVREPGFGLYHSLLDKKLRLGHIFPMVKVNFVFTMFIVITCFSQLYVNPWGFCRN